KIAGQSSWLPIWTPRTSPSEKTLILFRKLPVHCSISPKLRSTSPLVAKIAGASYLRASVFSHASNKGSEDFIACAKLVARLDCAFFNKNKSRYSSKEPQNQYGVRWRCGLSSPPPAPQY